MSWKFRHQGSPQAMEGLTLAQVLEGLGDGLWEPTDEVMGPEDTHWVSLEDHPQFAEIAADLEPPPPKHYDDETRLDMNPLIDVCLVLLIFFILTTTYAALQKFLPMAGISSQTLEGVPIVSEERVKEFTIQVEARLENGKPVIRVENTLVEPADATTLAAALRRYVKETRRTELLLDASPDVDWGTIVMVQDAANGAKVHKVHYAEREQPRK